MGLVYTRKPQNIKFVKQLRANQEPYVKETYNHLNDAIAMSDVLAEYGTGFFSFGEQKRINIVMNALEKNSPDPG